MKLQLTIKPDQQAIFFIDKIMESYIETYHPELIRECCFVTHELIINAVEAMNKAQKTNEISITIHCTNQELQVTVTDCAGGIPKEQWNAVLEENLEIDDFSDRGRGLFFIKHMVDDIWFEQPTVSQFLVGIRKALIH